jgi:hypothetical protein
MLTKHQPHAYPQRGVQHEALECFVGEWTAEGHSFGGPSQDPKQPRANPARWSSTHSARWHTGKFFLIQDERADVGSAFDTLCVMGWDDQAGCYFARTFENHGFHRHYDVTVQGDVWTLSGQTERARIEFGDNGNRQTITWEWRPKDEWLPLCDRVATRL